MRAWLGMIAGVALASGASAREADESYALRPLPRALRSAAADPQDPLPWPPGVAPLPTGFRGERLEIRGRQAIAIGQSWPLDPSGEFYGFSYWLFLSQDGGRSWHPPLYMGLTRYAPYDILHASRLPLRHGRDLLIEVRIHELDSLIREPASLLREAEHLYLRIPLTDLTRDSDGDGLTDMLERHLLLDPHNPDSDGDGIPDGEDAMPNVKRAPADTTGKSAAMALLLDKVLERPAGMPAPVRGNGLADPMAPVVVRGDPALFAPLQLPFPVLVYDKDTSKRLDAVTADAAHFGVSWTFTGDDHAVARYGFDAGHGTYDLTRDASGWHLRELSSSGE